MRLIPSVQKFPISPDLYPAYRCFQSHQTYTQRTDVSNLTKLIPSIQMFPVSLDWYPGYRHFQSHWTDTQHTDISNLTRLIPSGQTFPISPDWYPAYRCFQFCETDTEHADFSSLTRLEKLPPHSMQWGPHSVVRNVLTCAMICCAIWSKTGTDRCTAVDWEKLGKWPFTLTCLGVEPLQSSLLADAQLLTGKNWKNGPHPVVSRGWIFTVQFAGQPATNSCCCIDWCYLKFFSNRFFSDRSPTLGHTTYS